MWNLISKPASLPAFSKIGSVLKIILVSAVLGLIGISGARAQSIDVGGTYTLSVTWSNNNSVAETGVVVTSNVPPDLTYLACIGGTSCSQSAGTVTWNVGTLNSGQKLILYYDFTVTSCAASAVTFMVTGTSASPPGTQNAAPLIYSVNCPTNTPTDTPTITSTATITLSPTPTLTPTITQTPTITLTPTITNTPTLTPTPTQTNTITFTPTPTTTFTITMTPTITNTLTPTATFTPTCPILLWPDPYSVQYAHDHALKISCLPPNGSVAIYDLSGELVNVIHPSGDPTEWLWAKNRNGIPVSPGIYFYVIKDGQTVLQRGKFLITP